MHIYAFGSVCRGDVSVGSDIDLLAIVQGHDARFDPNYYSIYSYDRIREIWMKGNPFAWHLALESRLLYSSHESDFLSSLGKPGTYSRCHEDCEKFFNLFREACDSFQVQTETQVFDLSMVFLAIRNFATCFSLGMLDQPDFSRNSALRLGHFSLAISNDAYSILERARILCTRAIGKSVTALETDIASKQFSGIEEWMKQLLMEVQESCSTNLMTV